MIDLEQLPVGPVVDVLGRVEVGDVRLGPARPQRLLLVVAEPEGLADQARLVGVDDPSRFVPHLHAGDARAEHVCAHRAVERRDRGRVAVDEPVASAG